jgi:ParB/RepB/Spo0J family partition protein
MSNKKGGLEALCVGTGTTYNVPLENLVELEGFNVREDFGDLEGFSKSIADGTDFPPLKVRFDKDLNKVVIIDGHRRYRATKIAIEKHGAEIKSLPCYNEKRGSNEESRIVDMFTCNNGKPLTATEQAKVIARLMSFNWKIAEISRRIGKSQNYVSGLLKLQESSKELHDAIRNQIISTTAAITLAKESPKDQARILEKLSADLAKTGTPTQAKKTIKVKHIEKETRGTPIMIPSNPIKAYETKVEALVKDETRKDHKTWVAVLYGLQLALGTAEFSEDFKA